MNAMNDVAEARATALSLRASAKACTREQGALKFRLIRAAESLDAMVLLAVRGFDRIEQLEQQLAAVTAGSGCARQARGPGPSSGAQFDDTGRHADRAGDRWRRGCGPARDRCKHCGPRRERDKR
jgi:hypothetical protein